MFASIFFSADERPPLFTVTGDISGPKGVVTREGYLCNYKIHHMSLVHFKRLDSRGFHDLFNHYLCFFSKHNEYCKTKAYNIWVNFSRFF